jgi:adenylate kinase family enzyme
MIILVLGLPGAGKTALSELLASKVNFIHINADAVRKDLSSDLGFTNEDRIEQARRMGAVARLLNDQGQNVIVDFICPTEKTRNAFGSADKTIWVDRIQTSRYENTNSIWQDPTEYDLRIKSNLTVEQEVELAISAFKLFDWTKPTTLLLGRYQPWHDGHAALKQEAHKRTKQVVVGVRTTHNTSEKDPFSYSQVKNFIEEKEENPFVVQFPNITNIVYGRDVGYKIEKVELSSDIESISATQIRSKMESI